jgi:undecaprenyl-phosphate 4-deoxy-4-formamido-L-arabinose transferase
MSSFPFSLSVVVPIYNSEDTLRDLVHRIDRNVKDLVISYEIVAVDDGSGDGSWAKLEALKSEYPQLRLVRLARNFGQHNALLCGVREATGDAVVTMDDDLQHPPEEIEKLLAKLLEGFDVVYGAPIDNQQASWRRIPSLLPKYIQAKVLGVPNANDISPFRAFWTHLRTAFEGYDGSSPILDVLLSWGGRRFGRVSVAHMRRKVGRSNYNVWKLYQTAWLMITEFTLLPLRIVMLLGILGSIAGLIIFGYTLITYLFRGSLPGFPFLASTIALFSSAQLLALGTLGEYLARVHLRLSGRPPYVKKAQHETGDTLSMLPRGAGRLKNGNSL